MAILYLKDLGFCISIAFTFSVIAHTTRPSILHPFIVRWMAMKLSLNSSLWVRRIYAILYRRTQEENGCIEGVFQHFYICFILGVYKFGRATLCFFSRNKIFSCRFNLFQACACRYSQIHILFHVILNGVYIQCSISSVSYQYVTIKSTATN